MLQGICRMSSGEMPVWGAALIAVGCRARRNGDSDPIEWQMFGDFARYSATGEVIVEPFGVKLLPGDILEVRWANNESGYGLTIRRTPKLAKRGRPRTN
jgi:hypothetical protein